MKKIIIFLSVFAGLMISMDTKALIRTVSFAFTNKVPATIKVHYYDANGADLSVDILKTNASRPLITQITDGYSIEAVDLGLTTIITFSADAKTLYYTTPIGRSSLSLSATETMLNVNFVAAETGDKFTITK